MRKRILATVLCLAMLGSVTACGQTNTTKESSEVKPVQSESVVSTEKQEDVVEKEPVTITMEIFDRGKPAAWYENSNDTVLDNKYVNMLKEAVLEELNINLEYVAIPRSEENTKIQALMAAKNEPDIFFTYSRDQYLLWAGDDALADLTEYMNNTEAGRSLSAYLGEDVLEFGQLGGKQYSINAPVFGGSQLCSFIRKDLVEAVGMELLEVNGHYAMTPSMLEEALTKIKTAGYCEYPYGILNAWQSISPINGAFVDDKQFDTPEEIVQNAEDTFFLVDGTKEAYRFLNKCYNNGLIHPDFVLYKETNLGEQIAAGECAFWSYAAWKWIQGAESSAATLYGAQPDAEIVAVEIVQEDLSPARYYKSAAGGVYGMVSSNCENVEAALELISWLNTSETAHILTRHGIEGETFERDKEGDLVHIADAAYNYYVDMNLWMNYCPCRKTAENIIKDYIKTNAGLDERLLTLFSDAYWISISEGKENRVLAGAVINSANEWATSLAENKDNLVVGSITTTIEKFDEVYDKYLEVYLKEGGSQIAQERLESIK